VIFAVGGGGGDRRASIGESAKTADKAAPERSAGKPIEIPAGQARADQANQVAEALGPQRSAGAYVDSETDAMIVTVVDDAAGAAVRSKGGRPKLVNNSAAKLAATEKALAPDVEVAGVAYGVDVANNKVLVTVDGSVSDADRNKIKAAVQTAALVSRGPATTLHPAAAPGHAGTELLASGAAGTGHQPLAPAARRRARAVRLLRAADPSEATV